MSIIHGDNLEVMRGMPSASIDLIYLDPPFNTGRDFGAFNDRWKGVPESTGDSLIDDYIALTARMHSKAMASYLAFIAVRLIEMRRLMRETGSIYLHCDDTAVHYLKHVICLLYTSPSPRD